MYQGTNTKAIRSQTEIAQSMVRLMLEKPYEKILISDICEKAGLSRRTFYNLFDSREEVLRFYLLSICREPFERLSQKEDLIVEDITDIFSSVLESNRDLLITMTENHLSGIITDAIADNVTLFARRFLKKDSDKDLLPYYEAILSGAISKVMLLWLTTDQPLDTDRFVTVLRRFLNGEIYSSPEA